MEPVKTKINYVIYTTVLSVAKFDIGWFVLFNGSRERLFFGTEEPSFNKGDKVKITFERIDDAQDVKAPI